MTTRRRTRNDRRRNRCRWLLPLVVLLPGACGGVTHKALGHTCKGSPGSITDVAHEPAWKQYANYQEWLTAQNCRVRIDVLGDRPGPAHCGWAKARVLVTGIPFGTRYSRPNNTATYVRDPEGVYGRPDLKSGFHKLSALPAGAIDSGYRLGGTELWIAAGEPGAIYLKAGTAIELWPRGDPPLCS